MNEIFNEVEFWRDSAGIPYLMEINPRLSASVELAVRVGVDFPYLLYQWANGDHIPMVKEYRTGIKKSTVLRTFPNRPEKHSSRGLLLSSPLGRVSQQKT